MGSGASAKIAEALGDADGDEHVMATVGSLSAAHRTKLCAARREDSHRATCDDGHDLCIYVIPCSGFCCERCGEDLEEGGRSWRCEECGGLTIGACCSLPLPPEEPEPGEETAVVSESPPEPEEHTDAEHTDDGTGMPPEQFVKIEGSVELHVYSMAGLVCQLEADSSWTIERVKDEIQTKAKIDTMAQRLLCIATLLENDDQLANFGTAGQGNTVCLTLLKRSDLQVEWLRKLRTDPDFSKAPAEVCADRFVVLAAVTRYGANIRFADVSLQADREVIETALKTYPPAFWSAPACLQEDREFVIHVMEEYSLFQVYRGLSEALRRDVEVARCALAGWGQNLDCAPENITDDAEMRKLAVKNGYVYRRARRELKEHFWVAFAAVCEDPSQLRWVPERLREDHLFALNLVLTDGELLHKLPKKHLADAEVVKAARENGFRGEDLVKPRRRSSCSPIGSKKR